MKNLRRLGLPGLVLAVALVLASCGGSGGGDQGEGMQGMDHSGSGDTQASEQAAPETTGGDMQGMEGMDHGSTSMDETARTAVAPNGEYSDAAFVDAMVPHHEGAVEMAEVALDNAEHEEVHMLAREIIVAQRAEIEELRGIREDLGAATMDMSGGEMEGMSMSEDPRELAGARPFDRAFIDAMTPHHESATAMAEVALEESENPEIRRIAEDIASSQKHEISQMRQWREEWYPKG